MTEKKIKSIKYNLNPIITSYYGYDILDSFVDILNQYVYDKVFFISDETIYNLHGRMFVENLNKHGVDNEVLQIKCTEKDKTFRNANYICNYLIDHKISKDSVIISFGGGVAGNIIGLVAGLIYRGVRYIEIPTTFMGLTDGTLSHKQAVNGDSGKNQIGLYYAPLFIWSDIIYVETETTRNIKAAIVEGVKNVLIQDNDYLEKLTSYIKGKNKFNKDDLYYLFELITQSKNRILERDPTERGYSVVLEYGHTFGHAIEFLTLGNIFHGEAVSIGMCIAAEVSNRLGKISKEDVELHYNILSDLIYKNNKNIGLIKNFTADQILTEIESDNKRTKDGIKYVILDKIGKCSDEDGSFLIKINKDIIIKSITAAFDRILAFI